MPTCLVPTSRFDKRTRLRASGCLGTEGPFNSEGICCSMNINGGLWMVHPTTRGKALMEAWAAVSDQPSSIFGSLGKCVCAS